MKIICGKCKKEYLNLEKRKCDCGGIIFPTRGYWAWEKIKNGFERYMKENGHFPTAYGVDLCDYLPASRSIQRTFGGLINIRKKLNLDIIDYSKGSTRSGVARQLNIDSKNQEDQIHKILSRRFGEEFVHREKPIGLTDKYKIRTDFYIYDKKGKFAIDIFMPKNIKTLQKCIHQKIQKIMLAECNDLIYLVNLNINLPQEQVDEIVKHRKTETPSTVKVINIDKFFISQNIKI